MISCAGTMPGAVAMGGSARTLWAGAGRGRMGIDWLARWYCEPGSGRICSSFKNVLLRRMAVACVPRRRGPQGYHSRGPGPLASAAPATCTCTGSCVHSARRENWTKTAHGTQSRGTPPTTQVTAPITVHHAAWSRASGMDQGLSHIPTALMESMLKELQSDRQVSAFRTEVCAAKHQHC